MTTDPRLEILPQFQIRAISLGPQTALVTGTFSRAEGIAIDHRGWLFVSESESSIADIVTLEGKAAGLDIPNWSMTDHLHEGATLPWLDSRWQARDLAFLLDRTKEWQRVKYKATDAVVFAKKVLRCEQCGWTGDSGAELLVCPKCSGDLKEPKSSGTMRPPFRWTQTRVLSRRAADSGTMTTV